MVVKQSLSSWLLANYFVDAWLFSFDRIARQTMYIVASLASSILLEVVTKGADE